MSPVSLPFFPTQPQPMCEKLISELKELAGGWGGSVLWKNPGLAESVRDWAGWVLLGVTPCPAAFFLPALPWPSGSRMGIHETLHNYLPMIINPCPSPELVIEGGSYGVRGPVW